MMRDCEHCIHHTDDGCEKWECEFEPDIVYRSDIIDGVELTDWYHQNKNKDMVHGANSDEHQAWYKSQDIYKTIDIVPSASAAVLKKVVDISDECIEAIADAVIKKMSSSQNKGKWIDTGSGQECSECHEIQPGYDNFRNYCANCGADMRQNNAPLADDDSIYG